MQGAEAFQVHGLPQRRVRPLVLGVLGSALLADGPMRGAAAEPDGSAAPTPAYVVETWRGDRGLPHDTVHAVAQTRDGYLWLGTEQGLARFDGVRFQPYTVMDTPELGSSRIRCLLEDRAGVLWIGTAGGGLVRWQDGQFTAITTKSGLSSDAVLCLAEDAAGPLWVGTASGLNRLVEGRVTTFFRLDGLPDDRVEALVALRGGEVVMATPRGLGRVSGDRVLARAEAVGEDEVGIQCLLEDAAGGLWVGGRTGWRRWEGRSAGAAMPVRLPGARTLACVARRNGEMWVGTAAGEVFAVGTGGGAGGEELARLVWRFGKPVTALCEDWEGNLWVGTAGEGVHRLKPRRLHWEPLPEAVEGQPVWSLEELAGGRVALAVGAKGLWFWENGAFTPGRHPRLPEGVFVRAVCGDGGGTGGLWLGTLGDGLFHWVGETLRRYGPRDGLSDSAVEVLLADGGGGVWVGTRNGGLNQVREGRITRHGTPWGFTGAYASALARDPAGDLWIGTTGDGLFRLSQGEFAAYGTREGLPSGQVRAVVVDERGTVWVATAGGLAMVAQGRSTAFTTRHGLVDDAVTQLQADGEGWLWLGSGQGIYRIQKGQLEAYAQGRTRWLDVVGFGRTDGLPYLQSVPEAQVTGVGRAGRVWFSTTKGLVRCEPEGLRRNERPPPVLIERVYVGNEAVTPPELLRLGPGRQNLRIEYTALSLTAPEKVRFRYRLEGFEEEWSDVGGSRVARYSQVPPRRYRFQVTACNEDGVWNEAGATLALVVRPHWWASGWFRVALFAAGGGMVVGWFRLRQARRREIERLRIRIANDLHDEVGSSLWSITLLTQMLREHGEMGAEERRDLAEVHRMATLSARSIRDIVWWINPTYDTAQDLVLRMQDFCGTALRGVEYRLDCDGLDRGQRLPLELRQNVFLLFKEAITNVVKHARASRVEIRLRGGADGWELSVRDNGAGFDTKVPTSGVGLGSMALRARQAGGELEVESRPGAGTTVRVASRRGIRARGSGWLRGRW